MNILILANTWFPIDTKRIFGGIEKVVINQYNVLSKYGNNVKILSTLDAEDCNFIEKFDFYSKSYKKTRINTKNVLSKIVEVVDNNQIDIILAHIESASVIRELSKFKVPTIFFNHNNPYMGMISKTINEAYRYATINNCLTVSPSEYTLRMNNNLVAGCIKRKLSSYAIVDRNCYTNVSGERNGKVISAARIMTGTFENAMTIAFNKSDRECEIYGVLNQEYKDFFNEKIFPYLNDKVRYIGNIPHIQLLLTMSQSSLLVHPVWDDAYPNIVIESLSSGLPIILVTKKDSNGAIEVMKDLGIEYKNMVIDLYRKREKETVDLFLDKIEYFFTSEYNTLDYRKYISYKCREYFTEERFYKNLLNAIDIARKGLFLNHSSIDSNS